MIDHDYKCVFIHSPKTGGTSMLDAFDKNWDMPDSHYLLGGMNASKNNWVDYAINYPNYLRFTIIRNPWDRFISGWKYCKTTKDRTLIDVLNNLPKEGHDYCHVTRTQKSHIHDGYEYIVQFIIKYENFQEDFDKLCKILKKPKRRLKQLNTTEHNHYSTYFNTVESKKLFKKHFKEDIELYNKFTSGLQK